MSADLILANIARHVLIDENETQSLKDLLVPLSIRRKEFVLRTDDPCNKLYFVNQGLLRTFLVGRDGKEATIMFAMKDWWVTDMPCFVSQKPAIVNIQAVEKKSVDFEVELFPLFSVFGKSSEQQGYQSPIFI